MSFTEHPKWRPFCNVKLFDGTVTTSDKLTQEETDLHIDLAWPLTDEQRVTFGLTMPAAMNDD